MIPLPLQVSEVHRIYCSVRVCTHLLQVVCKSGIYRSNILFKWPSPLTPCRNFVLPAWMVKCRRFGKQFPPLLTVICARPRWSWSLSHSTCCCLRSQCGSLCRLNHPPPYFHAIKAFKASSSSSSTCRSCTCWWTSSKRICSLWRVHAEMPNPWLTRCSKIQNFTPKFTVAKCNHHASKLNPPSDTCNPEPVFRPSAYQYFPEKQFLPPVFESRIQLWNFVPSKGSATGKRLPNDGLRYHAYKRPTAFVPKGSRI